MKHERRFLAAGQIATRHFHGMVGYGSLYEHLSRAKSNWFTLLLRLGAQSYRKLGSEKSKELAILPPAGSIAV